MNDTGQSWISRCSASVPILLKKTSNAELSAFLGRACLVLNHTALETMWGNSRKMASPNKTTWRQPFVRFSLTLLWECLLLPATVSGSAWYWTHVEQTIPAPKEPAVQSCACFGDVCCTHKHQRSAKPSVSVCYTDGILENWQVPTEDILRRIIFCTAQWSFIARALMCCWFTMAISWIKLYQYKKSINETVRVNGMSSTHPVPAAEALSDVWDAKPRVFVALGRTFTAKPWTCTCSGGLWC